MKISKKKLNRPHSTKYGICEGRYCLPVPSLFCVKKSISIALSRKQQSDNIELGHLESKYFYPCHSLIYLRIMSKIYI